MNEFERVWEQFERFVDDGVPIKEACELFWRKGVCDGKEAVLREIRPLVAPSVVQDLTAGLES